jgi:multidrug efflux pump subunit AcrA (membrane-fusion protein)
MDDRINRRAPEFRIHAGQIELTAGLPPRFFVVAIFFVLGLLSLYLCLSQYTRTTRAFGILVTADNVADLVAPSYGQVSHVYVNPGDVVSDNDPIISLSSEQRRLSQGFIAPNRADDPATSDSAPETPQLINGIYILRAQHAGTVAAVQVKTGQIIDAGYVLVTLVAERSPVVAEIYVTSNAIGSVVPGGRVVLRYDSFPYQNYGIQVGHIARIFESPIPAADASAFLGKAIAEPTYRVQVTLNSEGIRKGRYRGHLKPGMTLQADVQVETRRLVGWLFEPFIRTRQWIGGVKSTVGSPQ